MKSILLKERGCMEEGFRPTQFFELQQEDFLELFSQKEPVWFALKKLRDYIQSQTLGLKLTAVSKETYLIHPEKISIGNNTKIFPGACIEGPCIIGNHVEIGPGAFIRPYSLIGDFCKVGHATEIKESILLSNAKAPHFNYVGDSILGHHVNLGAGVVCANFKLNKGEVVIHHKEGKIMTGMKKLGAIIGDASFLGCNSVTNPGTILKKGFLCSPCSNIKGTILV